jgi:hypothetical protein
MSSQTGYWGADALNRISVVQAFSAKAMGASVTLAIAQGCIYA